MFATAVIARRGGPLAESTVAERLRGDYLAGPSWNAWRT